MPRTEYAKYAKAFPLAKQLDFKVPSKWLRRGVGATEILAGAVLLAVPHRLTKVCNLRAFLVRGRKGGNRRFEGTCVYYVEQEQSSRLTETDQGI